MDQLQKVSETGMEIPKFWPVGYFFKMPKSPFAHHDWATKRMICLSEISIFFEDFMPVVSGKLSEITNCSFPSLVEICGGN